MIRDTHQERFWSKVRKTEGCWEWIASQNGHGYGQFNFNGKPTGVHRLSYEWSVGPIPEGMMVDHLCHLRSCVRPDHLRLATPAENQENRSGVASHNRSSGVRNVRRCGPGWRVDIGHAGKKHYLGTYATVEEAEQVAINGRARLFRLPAEDFA